MRSVAFLAVFCTSALLCLSSFSSEEDVDHISSPLPEPSNPVLDPSVLFAKNPSALAGASDTQRADRLFAALTSRSDGGLAHISLLLRDLDKMKSPYVSEPVARIISSVLERNYQELLSKEDTVTEFTRLFGDPRNNEPIRFMYDLGLLHAAPLMRHYLVRSFYRLIAQLKNSKWLSAIVDMHLETIPIHGDQDMQLQAILGNNARVKKTLRALLPCVILETAYSANLLVALCKGLSNGQFSVLGHASELLASQDYTNPTISLYGKLIETYLRLEPPPVNMIIWLQFQIDWKRLFKAYEVVPGTFRLYDIPECFRLSLPIASNDPGLSAIFYAVSINELVSTTTSLIFEQTWHDTKGFSSHVQLGIKGYIGSLERRGELLYAKAFAIAMRSMHGTKIWGASGDDWNKNPDLMSTAPEVAYHPDKPHVSSSSWTKFVSLVLRPFDEGAIERVLRLCNGWTLGVSKEEAIKVKNSIVGSNVHWINRLLRVAKWKKDEIGSMARQGRLCSAGQSYKMRPPHKTALLILSLVFGVTPLDSLSGSERQSRLSMVRSQYPWFVALVQALEALTGKERNKSSRIQALIELSSHPAFSSSLLYEWLFTRYLSAEELLRLIETCNTKSPFWRAVVAVCKTASFTQEVPLGALKQCASVVKKALLDRSIAGAKVRAMAVALGIPEGLVEGVLGGSSRHLSKILPSIMAGPESDSKTSKAPLESWIDSLPESQLSQAWLVLLNLSDDEIIAILRNGGPDLYRIIPTLSKCLSASARSQLIAEASRKPSTYNDRVIVAVAESQAIMVDGWELESAMFDDKLLENERYIQTMTSEGGVFWLVADYYNSHGLMSTGMDRFNYFALANFHPNISSYVRDICHMEVGLDTVQDTSQLGSETDVARDLSQLDFGADVASYLSPMELGVDLVLPMFLGRHTIVSIGRSLYFLVDGHLGRLERVLSSASVKQEYIGAIRRSASEYGKSLQDQSNFLVKEGEVGEVEEVEEEEENDNENDNDSVHEHYDEEEEEENDNDNVHEHYDEEEEFIDEYQDFIPTDDEEDTPSKEEGHGKIRPGGHAEDETGSSDETHDYGIGIHDPLVDRRDPSPTMMALPPTYKSFASQQRSSRELAMERDYYFLSKKAPNRDSKIPTDKKVALQPMRKVLLMARLAIWAFGLSLVTVFIILSII